jgi:hypothetical protein
MASFASSRRTSAGIPRQPRASSTAASLSKGRPSGDAFAIKHTADLAELLSRASSCCRPTPAQPHKGPTCYKKLPPALWLWPKGRRWPEKCVGEASRRASWIMGDVYLTADIALIGWVRRMEGLTPPTNSSGDHVATSSAILCSSRRLGVTATSTVTIFNDRLTSIPAVRFAEIGLLTR